VPVGITIIGALGKMGREIAEIVYDDPECYLEGAVEYPDHPLHGKEYSTPNGISDKPVFVTDSLTGLSGSESACIDFSSPASLQHYLPQAAEKKRPVVIGTTGLAENDLEFIKSFSTAIPIIVSPNMSLGVNLLFLLTELVSERLKDSFDIEIIEAHHRFKKDSPSGTAKRIGEIAAAALGLPYDSCIENGRVGISPDARKPKSIGMHAVRGGDIVGDHTVLFAGIGERLELRHVAHSRSNFARGSVLAAKWLSKQQPGFYTMRDVLQL
jgi:4-hydroxy-tetrahydrodipicolinate reductase